MREAFSLLCSLPAFSLERDLISDIKNRVRSPRDASAITRLLATSWEERQDEIIGVRTVDALTFLPALLDGVIPLDYQGVGNDMVVDKEPGWWFMTPTPGLYRHYPHLPVTPDLPDTVMGVVEENNDIYRLGVFATCFARNVVPRLKPNWHERVYRLADQVDDFEGAPLAATYEVFTEMIYCGLTGENWFDLPVSQRVLNQLPEQFLVDTLLHRGEAKTMLKFLRQSVRERRGLVVVFNRRVMQGEFVVHETDTQGVTHTIHELAVRPANGYIDLGSYPIVAIKPMGQFEKKLLRDVGFY